MKQFTGQEAYDLRCEWGMEGLLRLAEGSGAVIIVDVISFSTAVDIAVSRGAVVYPFPWNDERSHSFAKEAGAVLAAGSRKDPQVFSLAPRSMLLAVPGMALVLPSLNGSTLSLADPLRRIGIPTFAGCLRNAGAVAAAAAVTAAGSRITVIPAGERWGDGSLRPAVEDYIGAGAILHALPGRRSPEAEAAVGVYLHFHERLAETLSACASGVEAAERGDPQDVALAAELNVSSTAPRLVDGRYQAG